MDRLNRSTKAEYWLQLLTEQAASGLTARAFCIHKGLAVQSFYQWKRKLLQPVFPKKIVHSRSHLFNHLCQSALCLPILGPLHYQFVSSRQA
jgi:hypothetical protein